MILFKLENGNELFGYPENWNDIKAGKYIEYLQSIAPEHPPELIELYEAVKMCEAADKELAKWEHKLKAGREHIARLVEASEAPKKAMHYFPEVYSNWKAAKAKEDSLNKTMTSNNWFIRNYLPYTAKVVSHFTDVPIDACRGLGDEHLKIGTLEYLYNKIVGVITSEPMDTEKQVYYLAGEVYELPSKHMAKSTLIEFAEAAQYEQLLSNVKNGELMALLDVAAVILRKQGEPYSDEVYERNRKAFEQMTMHDLFQIGFFLQKLNKKSAFAFLNSTLQRMAMERNDS